jgi:hypothetical protein
MVPQMFFAPCLVSERSVCQRRSARPLGRTEFSVSDRTGIAFHKQRDISFDPIVSEVKDARAHPLSGACGT